MENAMARGRPRLLFYAMYDPRGLNSAPWIEQIVAA
jgi:hypothetical protein